MNNELPEDSLSVALTKTPLVRYLKVPLTYAMLIAVGGMVPFFIGLHLGEDNYIPSLFIGFVVSLVLWLVGAEITRKDDRQLEILGHYFLTRGALNFVYRLANFGRSTNTFYRGEWSDL